MKEEEVEDDQTGEKHTQYSYDEEKVPKENWDLFISQKNTEDALQDLILTQMEE